MYYIDYDSTYIVSVNGNQGDGGGAVALSQSFKILKRMNKIMDLVPKYLKYV